MNTAASTTSNTVPPEDGSHYLAHYSSSAYEVSTWQDVPVANGAYRLRVMVRSSGGQTTAVVKARDFDASGTQVSVNLPATSIWSEIVLSGINVTNGNVRVVLHSVAPGGKWATFDNLRLEPESATTPIVIDNGDSGYADSGNWTVGVASGGYAGDYLHDNNTGSTGGKWATFKPGLALAAGNYKVSLWWKAHPNRASNATVRIYHVNGASSNSNGAYDDFSVNMRQGDSTNGQWNQIGGTFSMDSTDYVGILNNGADGYVIVDAVKFVRQ